MISQKKDYYVCLFLKELASRQEELQAYFKGGIEDSKGIIQFDYMKLNFKDELINAFNKMQRIYVLDDESKITIDDVENTIKILLEVFKQL